MLPQYAYFIGGIALFVVWLLLFLWRKDLRKEMLWASILALPFALTAFFWIPEYWDPPYLFNLTDKIGFGVETLIFAFSVGGVISVIYEVGTRKRLRKVPHNRKIHLLPYLVVFALYAGLEIIFPLSTVTNTLVALLTGSLLIGYFRRDLLPQIFFGGTLFAILYIFLLFIFTLLFPSFLSTFFTLKNFWGIIFWGVPLEEVVLAFAVGTFWSSLFEYMKGYRTKDISR